MRQVLMLASVVVYMLTSLLLVSCGKTTTSEEANSSEPKPMFTCTIYSDNNGELQNADGQRLCAVKVYSRGEPINLNFSGNVAWSGAELKEVYLRSGKVYNEYPFSSKIDELTPIGTYNMSTVGENMSFEFYPLNGEAQKEFADKQKAEREERERQAHAEKEAQEAERNKIVGTYEFQAHIPNTDKVVTGYSQGSGFTKESRTVGTIDGVEYLVVHPDFRVSLISPGNHKTYIGKVNEVVNGAFSVRCSDRNSKFGHGYTLYKSGREIGSAGDTFGGYGTFVIDTNNRRVYESVSDWKNADVSDTEYVMYDKFSTTVSISNDTEWQRNYYDQYRDRYKD